MKGYIYLEFLYVKALIQQYGFFSTIKPYFNSLWSRLMSYFYGDVSTNFREYKPVHQYRPLSRVDKELKNLERKLFLRSFFDFLHVIAEAIKK
jgi:hypothetical protein